VAIVVEEVRARADEAAPATLRRRPGPAVLVVALLVAVPFVVAIASVVGRHWYPSGDQALLQLRIDDVGGPHTPLVGAWSRWGWAHPGPALIWALTPFERAFGPTGVLVGTATINLLAALGAVAVGHRRGGLRLALLVGLVVALLVNALGLDFLIDPWNPWPAFLPFLLFLLLVWSVTCRDAALLPAAVAVGSFCVQCHVGYLPLVGALLVLALAFSVRAPRRWLAAAALAGLVVWLPPLVQQVTGDDGNLGLLVDYVRHPTEPSAGWEQAFGAMGANLRPIGPWVTGDDETGTGEARTGSTVPAVAVLVALAAAGAWARRRGDDDAARLSLVALVACGVGLIATSRVTGVFVPYVLRWWWAVAAVAMLAIVRCTFRRAGSGVAFAALVVVSVAAADGSPAALPLEDVSRAIAAVGSPTEAALDPGRRYVVRSVDSRWWGAAGAGLFLELEHRGVDVVVEPGPDAALTHGRWRLAEPDEVNGVVTIVDVPDLERGWQAPAGSRRVASWDPLSADERTRARELEASIRATMGPRAPDGRVLLGLPSSRQDALDAGAAPADVEALHDLQELGDGYVVFVSPAP
jgi:hypothetical protein